MNAKLRVAHVKCKKSLEFLTRYFFVKRNGKKFIVSKHHAQIIEKLEAVARGEILRLIINLPPRYGKTEIAVKNFVAWCLANNPAAKFIHLSYSDSLALDNSEEVKDLVSSEEFQELFPDVKIKTDSRAKNKWYTTAKGGILARSSSGQITGFGAGSTDEEDDDLEEFLSELDILESFGGAIIIDDPIKPDDANSDTIRDKVNLKFETTVRSRVNSRKTPIIVIMQRLHPEDLSGYLMDIEPDEWEVLCLRAIQEDGSALWEHKHTLDELAKIKKANEIVFDTQYMQNPKPAAGLVFPKESLNQYNGAEFDESKVEFKSAFVDIADSGDDDHSVPIGFNVGPKIFIHEVLYTKKGTDENIELTGALLSKHKPAYTRLESNMGGGMYKRLLEKYYSGVLLSINAKQNKHTRILTIAGFIKEFCYFRNDYAPGSDYDKFMQCLTRYLKSGESKHDDAPDSLHGLCNMIFRFYPHLYKDFDLVDTSE